MMLLVICSGRDLKYKFTDKASPRTVKAWHPLLVVILGSRTQKPSLGSYLSADL
jgi:hypothetical protein